MADAPFKTIGDAFLNLPFRRLLFLLLFIAVCLYVYDQSARFTFYGRLEKRIQALEKLQELELKGVRQSPDLYPIYQSITEELRSNPQWSIQIPNPIDIILKFLSAALVPFVFIFVSALGMIRNEPGGFTSFGGAIAFTLMMGIPAVIIPTFGSVWINVAIYAVLQAAIIVLLVKLGAKKA